MTEVSARRATVRRAGPGDDAALAAFFAATAMDADLVLRVDRSPRFSALYELQSEDWETWLAEDESGIVGCGTLLARNGYVAVERRRVGYLGDLRSRPGTGALHLINRLYGPVLRSFAARTGAAAFGTAIISSNAPAVRALASGRSRSRSRPVYTPLLDYAIRSVHLTVRLPLPRSDVRVRTALDGDVPAIARLLDDDARGRPFGTPVDEATLRGRFASWPGLEVASFLVAEDAAGSVRGCVAMWDAARVKRSVVLDYRGGMRRVRRLADVTFPLVRAQRLPRPGEAFRSLYATHQAVVDDDPQVLAALVAAAYRRYRQRGHHVLTFRAPLGHRLDAAFRGFHVTDLPATFYAVTLPGEPVPAVVQSGEPAFEIALI